MKNKRRLILMLRSTLVILMIAGICGGLSKYAITNAFQDLINANDKPSDTNVTPTVTITNTAEATITNTPALGLSPSPVPTPTQFPMPSVDPELTASPELSTSPELSVSPEVTDEPVPTLTEEPEPSAEPTPTATPTPEYYETNVVVIKCKVLNVRSSPSDANKNNITGKIYQGCYAVVLEDCGAWLKINSGELKEQYIAKRYTYSGYQAATLIDNMEGCIATITRTTNLRQGPCISEDYTSAAKKGATYKVHLSESTEDWLCVEVDDYTTAYIKATDATLSYDMETGLTNYQIKMNTFAGKLEAKLASSANLKVEDLVTTNRLTNGSLTGARLEFFKNYQMSDIERDFFAAVIQAEVGGHPYAAKLAAANVVVNRLLKGASWTGGDTITGVLSKPYQFAGANPVMTNFTLDPEKLAKYKKKIKADCYRAVDEAMAGYTNIPNYLFFQATKSAHSEAKDYPVLYYTQFTYIGDTYFYNGFHNASKK